MYSTFWKLLKNSRKKGMVFKPSFKCFKNEKIKSSVSKTRNFTLSEHAFIISSYSILIERFRLKQKKKVSGS